MKRLVCLLTCLMVLAPASELRATGSQEATSLTVQLVDRTGAPAAGVVVQILGSSRQVVREGVSDADGVVLLLGLPFGIYELHATSPLFTNTFEAIDLREPDQRVELALRSAGVEERVTVTASRGAIQQARKVPATVHTLDEVELHSRAVDLLPRMLEEEPGILTQQTTPGQGSPILRGQSAQAVLYLFDGIRYNNATYRAGNTQYLAWIPDVGVTSVETLLGPAGVNYGSDALGGAVNVLSKPTPGFSSTPATTLSGSVRAFGESSSTGGGLQATIGASTPALAGFLAASGARHSDMRGGGGRDSHHSTVRFLGFTDEQVQQAFGSRYVDTGFGQTGLTAKGAWRSSASSAVTGYFMRSEQFDVNRYDRLLGGDGRVQAAFTPQRLSFGYLRYEHFLDDTFIEVTASLNTQTDGRIDQRRPSSAVIEESNSDTVWGLESTASRSFDEHLVTGGFEAYRDDVSAGRIERSGTISETVRARVPNGANYTSLGLFLLDEWNALDDRLLVSGGARFSAFEYQARAADNVIGGTPIVPDTDASFTDLSFNLGATYTLTDTLGAWGRVARGFRAPSVFDFGEIGLTGGGFEVTPDDAVGINAFVGDSAGLSALSTGDRWNSLGSEVVWSYEGGLRYFDDDLRLEATGFVSNFSDTIVRRTLIVTDDVVGSTIGGETIVAQDGAGRIYVAGEPNPIVSRANVSQLRVWGLEFVAQRAFGERWMATVKAALQRGEELDTGFHARKIAPDNVTAVVRWRDSSGHLWVEGVVKGAARQDRFNPADFEDARIGAYRDAGDITGFFVDQGPRLGLVSNGVLVATGETVDQVIARVLGPAGNGAPLFSSTAGWLTLGLRGNYELAENQNLMVALNNFLDANYRMHGTGFDALGINLTVAYSLDF